MQRIIVFEQNGSSKRKIQGISRYGKGIEIVRVISIDGPLPPIIDDAATYLPDKLDADLALDFLRHPDLSYELALRCQKEAVPLVASGKGFRLDGVYTPPT